MENIISEKEKGVKRLSKYNFLLDFVIFSIIIFSIICIVLVIVNPVIEYDFNGKKVKAILSQRMRIESLIFSCLGLFLSMYPLISLKKIIKQLRNDNGETFSNNNIKMLDKSALCMGILVILKILSLVPSGGMFNMNHTRIMLFQDASASVSEISSACIGITFNFETMYLLSIVVFIIVLVEIIKITKILKEENELTI